MKQTILFLTLFTVFGCTSKGREMNNIVAADIGAVQNFARIKPNIAVSGQPNEENFKKAAESGYKTVINLRPREEWPFDEESFVKDLGMKYVLIPISSPDDLTFEKAKELSTVLEDKSAYPVLIHCGSSNRVGALYALHEYLEKKITEDQVQETGTKAGLTNTAYREKLEVLIKQK